MCVFAKKTYVNLQVCIYTNNIKGYIIFLIFLIQHFELFAAAYLLQIIVALPPFHEFSTHHLTVPLLMDT